MTSKNDSNNIEEVSEEIEVDESVSIDDFIRELEEKEKDLHISSEMVIEVEDSEFDEINISGSPHSSPDDGHRNVPSAVSSSSTIHKTNSSFDSAPERPVDILKFEAEIRELKNKVSKMEAERGEYLENAVRRQKDFENYKKRTERERGETFHKQLSNLASKMLPVLDNLNRALDSASAIEGEKLKEFQQFFDGIIMVNQQLNDIFVGMGVEPIKSVGEPFDPNFHEAVATKETVEVPSHTIIDELLRGYKIGEKVVRAAMVKVATSPATQAKSEREEDSSNEN
jgi:molecular chaperone GrpE